MSVVSYKIYAIDLSAEFSLKIIKLQNCVLTRNLTSNLLDLRLTPQPALHLTEISVIVTSLRMQFPFALKY